MPWQTTQPSLIARLGDHRDHTAWLEFDRRYGALIIAYGQRRGLSREDAEDVRQIVLVSLLRAMQSFQLDPARGRFRSYLGRVVANTIVRYRNRPHRRREDRDIDELLQESLPDVPQLDPLWEEEWRRHHLRQAMRTLEQSFEPRSVAIFHQLIQGETTGRVAANFGVSVEAVHKVKQRARNRLMTIVARQLQEEGEG